MKRIGLFIIQIILIYNAHAANSIYEQANAAYETGNYALADSLYTSLLTEDGPSAEVYYNLGNACYKQQFWARAILNYERCLQLDRRNEDAQYNLDLAQAQIRDQIEPIQLSLLSILWKDICGLLSSSVWAILAIVFSWLALCSVAVYLFARKFHMRRWGLMLVFITAGLSIILFVISELGVFEMRGDGLAEVENASRIFLDEYDHSRSGCAVLPACEGTRVLLVEVQALTATSPMENPRRRVTGLDVNRAHMLLAVMERRAGFKLSRLEVYLNIVGGVSVEEPAGDLAACFAVASSATEVKLPPATVFIGEVGLSGEVRAVNNLQQRIDESARLGFKQAVGPRLRGQHLRVPPDFRLLELTDLREGLEKFYLVER